MYLGGVHVGEASYELGDFCVQVVVLVYKNYKALVRL